MIELSHYWLTKYGLDADGIYSQVRDFVASKFSFEPIYSR